MQHSTSEFQPHPKRSTLGEQRRYIEFWQKLTEDQRAHVNRVSEDLPLDRASGLLGVSARLWDSDSKFLTFAILVGRICLNVFVNYHSFQASWAANNVVFGSGSADEGETVLQEDAVVICADNISGKDCIEAQMNRFFACRWISTAEFVAVATSAACSLVCFCAFVLCGNDRLPSRRPWFFFFLPRLAATFSSIIFLQYVNLARIRSVLFRGEAKLVGVLVWSSLVQVNYGKLDEQGEDTAKEVDSLHFSGRIVFSALFYLALVAFSFQALLVKMTAMNFASIRSFYAWTPLQWLLFAGFANQIGGVCQVIDVEIYRLLLFKFGGSASRFSRNSCIICVEYFSLLAIKIAHGNIGKSPMRAFAAMALFDSHDAQKLLISPQREEQLRKSRQVRLTMNEEVFLKCGLNYGRKLADFTDKALPSLAQCSANKMRDRRVNNVYLEKWELDVVVKLQAAFRAAAARRRLARMFPEKYKQLETQVKAGTAQRLQEVRDILQMNQTQQSGVLSWSGMVRLTCIVMPRLAFLRRKRNKLLELARTAYTDEPTAREPLHRTESTAPFVNVTASAQLLMAAQIQEYIEDLESGIQDHFEADQDEFKNSLPVSGAFSRSGHSARCCYSFSPSEDVYHPIPPESSEMVTVERSD